MKEVNITTFEHLFKTHVDQLYAYALGFLKEKEGAEDVVQEAYIYLWNNRDKIDSSTNILGYLHRAVKNASINVIEHQKVRRKYEERVRHEDERVTRDWHDIEELKEMRQKVLDAIDRLPEKSRRIFVMSAIEGLKYRDIAAQTNLSEETVRSHIKRSYRRLRNDPELSSKELLVFLMLLQLHDFY